MRRAARWRGQRRLQRPRLSGVLRAGRSGVGHGLQPRTGGLAGAGRRRAVVSRRRRGAPGELASPPGGTLARSLLSAGMRCWQAGRAQLAIQAAGALIAGVAPVATAWLLRALLDDLATGHPQRVVGLAVGLGVTGGVAALLPSAVRYAEAQVSRAITPTGNPQPVAARRARGCPARPQGR